MRNKALDVRGYSFSDSDTIMVDANIWLYLYGPGAPPMSWTASTYSGVFARILASDSKLFLDTLVLSEFINRYARLEMKRLQPAQNNYKAFRSSPDYPPVAKAIESGVKQILTVCQPARHPFDEWGLNDLLTEFGANTYDWNDQLIAENCKKQGFSLLANDGDFTEGGISVLTANSRLLTACP